MFDLASEALTGLFESFSRHSGLVQNDLGSARSVFGKALGHHLIKFLNSERSDCKCSVDGISNLVGSARSPQLQHRAPKQATDDNPAMTYWESVPSSGPGIPTTTEIIAINSDEVIANIGHRHRDSHARIGREI